jgi:hypothetical protein
MGLRAVVKKREPTVAKLPEKLVPLDQLPMTHNANAYLTSRFLDPHKLSSDWGLMYCPDDPHPLVADRIIIPIYMGGKLAGWQARYIGEPMNNNPPKYFTMPGTQRNAILYNYDRAKQYPFGVLVEGVVDVWSIGGQGVAKFGSSLSSIHTQLLSAAWGATGIALLSDGDVWADPKKREKYERVRSVLLRPGMFKWGVLELQLPEGVDPGNLNPTSVWNFIGRIAQEKGYDRPFFHPEAFKLTCPALSAGEPAAIATV